MTIKQGFLGSWMDTSFIHQQLCGVLIHNNCVMVENWCRDAAFMYVQYVY